MVPSSGPARGRARKAWHRAWAKARASAVVAEELHQLVGACRGVGPSQRDQVLVVPAVVVEVGQHVRLPRAAAPGGAAGPDAGARPQPGPAPGSVPAAGTQ